MVTTNAHKVQLAKEICHQLGLGTSATSISRQIERAGMSDQTVTRFVTDSVLVFCPQNKDAVGR